MMWQLPPHVLTGTKLSHFQLIAFAIILAILLAYFCHFALISAAHVFNAHPFISPDGFDWLTEGAYIRRAMLDLEFTGTLPVLRPPVFVFVTMLDAIFGESGIIIALAFTISAAVSFWLILRSSELFRDHAGGIIIVFVLTLLGPINYFRIWVLADPIAVALSIAAVFALREAAVSHGRAQGVRAVALVAAAGLTQTYAIIPPIAVTVALCLVHPTSSSARGRALILMTSGLIIIVLGKLLWGFIVPHAATPANFTMLKLSGAMIPFYKQTWGYFFLPLIPLAVAALPFVGAQKIMHDEILVAALLTVCAFAAFCILYQWPEARFTFAFWPYIILLFVRIYDAIAQPANRAGLIAAGATSAILLLLQSLFLTPQNYWQPTWRGISTDPNASWIVQYATAAPEDRFQLEALCSPSCKLCTAAKIPDGLDEYRKSSFQKYRELRMRCKPAVGVGPQRVPSEAPNPATAPTGLHYRLSNDGVLTRSDGVKLYASGQINGYVDTVRIQAGSVMVAGWAVDLSAQQPAYRVIAVLNGFSAAEGAPSLLRPDVAAALKLPTTQASGYTMTVHLPANVRQELIRLRVFALQAGGGARELNYPADYPFSRD